VRDALGPYLAVYLLTEQRWDEASIGFAMSIATIAGTAAQTPAGALVDATTAKRGLMIAAALLVTGASLIVPWLSSARNRRCVVHSRCRLHCRTRRLQRRVSYARWNSCVGLAFYLLAMPETQDMAHNTRAGSAQRVAAE